MRTLRLAMAQINTTVGDLEGNAQRILRAIDEAREQGADIIAFPEMALPGYPVEDLLLKPQFVRMVVVFPVPFGPKKPKISWGWTVRSISSTPRTLP